MQYRIIGDDVLGAFFSCSLQPLRLCVMLLQVVVEGTQSRAVLEGLRRIVRLPGLYLLRQCGDQAAKPPDDLFLWGE